MRAIRVRQARSLTEAASAKASAEFYFASSARLVCLGHGSQLGSARRDGQAKLCGLRERPCCGTVTPMHISAWIRSKRAEHGETQPEAARIVDVSGRTWGKWERGELVPDRLVYLEALALWGGIGFAELTTMAIASVIADDEAAA